MTITEEIFTPCDLVIYGGLGDLSRHKLIISLYRLENGNFLEPEDYPAGSWRPAASEQMLARDGRSWEE